jgi:ATP-dependent Clp protease ATP-binding subunit ClpC
LPDWNFGNFSNEAIAVVDRARDEARSFKHNWIGTEHLLLGLMHDRNGLVAQVLRHEYDLTLLQVQARVVQISGNVEEPFGEVRFTQRALLVFEHAQREALNLHQVEVNSLHILLGILREDASVAARILLDNAYSLLQIREKILDYYTRPHAAWQWHTPHSRNRLRRDR